MPQKRNPDAAELVRAKAGRIIGSLNAVLIVMKGLPLAYSKDMQEDKVQLFDALPSLSLSLAVMTGMIGDMEPNIDAMQAAAGAGFSTATDLADWLVREAGLPFRDAHHATGRIVAEAAERGISLEDVPLDVMQAVNPAITDAVYSVLSVQASVNSRTSFGGTAPDNVRAAAAAWLEKLATDAPNA
jgi:argininosuccinate lyase